MWRVRRFDGPNGRIVLKMLDELEERAVEFLRNKTFISMKWHNKRLVRNTFDQSFP